MMADLSCTIQPLKQVRLFGEKQSGCCVIDVNLITAAGCKIGEIHFTNNYTASLTLKAKRPGKSREGKYETLVKDFILMKSPHYANESQNKIVINAIEHGFSDECFVCLRFILRQPSPVWQSFSIENITLKTSQQNKNVSDEESQRNWLDESINKDSVTNHLKSIKDFAHIIRNVTVDNEAKSFDIDGSYDINLLSYS